MITSEDLGKQLGTAIDKLILHGNDAVEHLTDEEKCAVFVACGCKYSVGVADGKVMKMIFPHVGLAVIDGKYHSFQRQQDKHF